MGESAGNAAGQLVGGGLGAWLGGPWGIAASLILPTLLGGLFDRRRNNGPSLEELRRRAKAQLEGTAIENERNTQLANLLNSPALAAAQAQAIQGGQAGAQAINARLGQTGLGRSGVGMALEGAVRAAPDVQMAMMKGQLANEAMNKALEIQRMRAEAEMAGGYQAPIPGMAQQMLGATVAGALPAIMNYAFKAPIKPPTNHANMSPKQLNPTGATYGGTSIPVNAAPVGTTVPGNTYARSGYLSAKPKAWGFINRVEPDLPTYSSHDAWLRGLGREGMFNYAGHRNRVDIANGFKNAALRLPPFAQPVSPLYLDWQASQPFMNLWGN